VRANLQRLVADRAEPHAPQAHHGVADRLAHVAHLPRASLVQRDRDQRLILPGSEARVEQSHDGRRGPPSRDAHATPEPIQRILSRHAPHPRVVLPLHLVLRVQQALHERPVVREQQQAFGVVVEAPDRVDVLPHFRQQVEHGRSPLGVLPRRHVAARLVEQDVAAALREMDPLPVDADVVAIGVGFRAQLEDGRAVDRHASVRDERFSGAPGGDAGSGEDFLQTFAGRWCAHGSAVSSQESGVRSQESGDEQKPEAGPRTPNPQSRLSSFPEQAREEIHQSPNLSPAML
jgi:hypothetical protein